jgi:DNA-binding NtrC family response regulator
VRVLSSTSRDLRHEIEAGRFREDLYFRLAQVRVSLPALRERIEDIPLIVQKMLQTIGHGEPLMIEEEALRRLEAHPWPGNVRELKNALERAAAFASDGVIRRPEERSALDLKGTFKDAKDRAIDRFESAYLTALMRRCNGNLSLAAREADVARHYLRERLKKRELYGMKWGEEADEG